MMTPLQHDSDVTCLPAVLFLSFPLVGTGYMRKNHLKRVKKGKPGSGVQEKTFL